MRTSRNHGCPICVCFGFSKGELEILEYIQTLEVNAEVSNRDIISPKELDIYIPDKQIAIEYNGLYWHSSEHKPLDYHQNKYFACAEKGIELIQIWEDDWRDKRELVKTMLARKLGVWVTTISSDNVIVKKYRR